VCSSPPADAGLNSHSSVWKFPSLLLYYPRRSLAPWPFSFGERFDLGWMSALGEIWRGFQDGEGGEIQWLPLWAFWEESSFVGKSRHPSMEERA
jgi:hypothetical protein